MDRQTIRSQFPYPLARKYAAVYERTTGYLDRFTRAIDCLETTVRFCTTLLICEFLRLPPADQQETTSRAIVELLWNPKPSGGQWVATLRALCRQLSPRRSALFLPGLPGIYFEPSGKMGECGKQVFETLPNDRNTYIAHKTRNYTESDYKGLCEVYDAKLDRCFEALGFLTHYVMLVPTRIQGSQVDDWLEARGAGPFEAKRCAGPLPALPSLEADLSVLLMQEADGPVVERSFVVSPFFLYRYWFEKDTEDIYLFGHVGTNTRSEITGIQYSGFGRHTDELHISASDQLSFVFDAFLGALGPLAVARDRPVAKASPSASPYFAVQRTLIEQHTKFYVPRPEVDLNVAAFLEGTAAGYCVLTGVPGQGKSVLSAHFAAKGWPHHFIHIADPERRRWDRIIRSLLWQIAEARKIDLDIPVTDDELVMYYQETLGRAAVASSEKLVIVIDALDELSEGSDCRLDFLPAQLPANVYFVVTSREDEELTALRRKLAASGGPTEICVQPLTLDQVKDFMADSPLPADLDWKHLLQISEGNPLFLREVKRSLQTTGRLPVETSPTLEHYFSANLERVGLASHELMRKATALIAVSTEPIPLLHLARILGESERTVGQSVLKPMNQYLVRTGDGYAVYHRRFGDFLVETEFGSDEIAGARDAIIAYCDPCEEKGHWYALACTPPLLLQTRQYNRLLTLASSERFWAALERHLDYYQMSKRVIEILQGVERASRERRDLVTAAIFRFLKYTGHFAHDYELFDLVPETITRLAEQRHENPDDQAYVYLVKGDYLYLNCHYPESEVELARALDALAGASDGAKKALTHRVLQLLGLAHRRLAHWEQADACLERAANAATEAGSLFFQADNWICLANSKTQQQQFEMAHSYYARGIAKICDLIAAFDNLAPGQKEGVKDRLHAKANLASYYTYQALYFVAQDRIDEAAGAVDRSEAIYRELEGASQEYSRHHYERFLYAKAWLLGLTGRLAEGESLARTSVERSERAIDRANALYVLGWLLLCGSRASGADATEAEETLTGSARMFEDMGMPHEAERARRELTNKGR